MLADMPDVSLVRIVFMACGMNDAVVQNAAAKPMVELMSMRCEINEALLQQYLLNKTYYKCNNKAGRLTTGAKKIEVYEYTSLTPN